MPEFLIEFTHDGARHNRVICSPFPVSIDMAAFFAWCIIGTPVTVASVTLL